MMNAITHRQITLSLLWYTVILSVAYSLCLVSVLDIKTFFILVVVIFGSSPLIFAVFRRGADALSPEVILPFTYMLYALGPLMGPLYGSLEFSYDVSLNYIILQALGLLSMRIGLHIATRTIMSFSSDEFIKNTYLKSNSYLLATGIIMLFLGALSITSQIIAFGGLTKFLEVGYGTQYFLTLSEATTIGGSLEWWLLGAILLIFYGLMRQSKPAILLGVVLFVPVALFIILETGRRSHLLYPILFGLALFHYGYRRLPSYIIVPGLLIGVMAAQYYALARYYLSEGLIYGLTQVLPSVINNPYLIAPWMANHFRMPAASLLEVLQYGGPGLLFGQSYLAAVGAPIPFIARLFAEVGFNPNVWRVENFYPEILTIGGGFGFSPVTEGYINFGILGIIVHMFAYGYIIGIIYARLISRPSLPILLLLAGSFPVFMLDGLTNSSSSFVYKWTRIYLLPWIIYWGLKIFLPRSKEQHRSDSNLKTKNA